MKDIQFDLAYEEVKHGKLRKHYSSLAKKWFTCISTP